MPASLEGREIKGRCHGVRIVRRGRDDPHACIQILREDDEHWFEIGNRFSSYWLPDLIETLKRAHNLLQDNAKPDPSGYGYLVSRRKTNG